MPSTLGQISAALRIVDNLNFLPKCLCSVRYSVFMMFLHQEFDVAFIMQPLLERSDMFAL